VPDDEPDDSFAAVVQEHVSHRSEPRAIVGGDDGPSDQGARAMRHDTSSRQPYAGIDPAVAPSWVGQIGRRPPLPDRSTDEADGFGKAC
jgi:hypothetical protein